VRSVYNKDDSGRITRKVMATYLVQSAKKVMYLIICLDKYSEINFRTGIDGDTGLPMFVDRAHDDDDSGSSSIFTPLRLMTWREERIRMMSMVPSFQSQLLFLVNKRNLNS
jgi:hypothetical protein